MYLSQDERDILYGVVCSACASRIEKPTGNPAFSCRACVHMFDTPPVQERPQLRLVSAS